MGSPFKGNYSAKHPPGARSDPRIDAALGEKVMEGRVSCAAAWKISQTLEVAPAAVGLAADLLDYRISRCQMGLFGYSPEKRIVRPAEQVEGETEKAIRAALKNGRLACADAWKIAEKLARSRLEIAGVCEALQIRISPCQLGAF